MSDFDLSHAPAPVSVPGPAPVLEPPPPAPSAAAAALVAARRATPATGRDASAANYHAQLAAIEQSRGLPLALPLLATGRGRGARVRLADGREVLDLVAGLGPYVFGHDDADLMETAVLAAASDVAFQSHVLPGREYAALTERLLSLSGPWLRHAWLSLSGSMANENALKMVFQRRAPADRVLAFDRAFHGRTLAMAELTDRPEYRDGLPTRDFVDRVPFYDPQDPESTQKSVAALEAALAAHPGRHAAMCFELIQGEGGFQGAPGEFFAALMAVCRRAGVSVWVDEIQTFGRTRGLFAFRTLSLDAYVDVVTLGKILQGSATLFTADHAPRPKLIAGTWAGSTVGMALGARILERLVDEGYAGAGGRIDRLEARLERAFARLDRRLPGVLTARSGGGAMQAFVAWSGDPATTAAIVLAALEEGVLLQTAGASPMKIRLLPPLNLTDEEIDAGFAAIERALRRIARERALPIDARAASAPRGVGAR